MFVKIFFLFSIGIPVNVNVSQPFIILFARCRQLARTLFEIRCTLDFQIFHVRAHGVI